MPTADPSSHRRSLPVLVAVLLAAAGWVAYVAWPTSRAASAPPSDAVAAPRPDTAAPLTAKPRAADARETTTPSPEAEPKRSTLDQDLRVRVVDHRGQPLFELPLQVCTEEQLQKTGHQPIARVLTDRQGMAVFRDLRRKMNELDKVCYLVHDVCFEQPPKLLLDAKALAAEVVERVQPAYGSIAVVVDGQGIGAGAQADLAVVRHGEAEDPTLAWQRKSWTSDMHSGRAAFHFVELGRRYCATVRRSKAEVGSEITGDGPGVPGEQVELRVPLDADHPVAVFRAITADGTPLAHTKLRASIRKDWGGTIDPEVVTDAAGRFRIDLRERAIFSNDELLVRCNHQGREIAACTELPTRLGPGRHDRGDLVLRPLGVLLAGHAFDSAGRPVAGVLVRAGASVFHASAWGSSLEPRTLSAKTGVDGSFELTGVLRGSEHHVWVDADYQRSDPVTARAGDRDVRLQVYKICRPVVTVRLPDGMGWDGSIGLSLRRPGSNESVATPATAQKFEKNIVVQMGAVKSGRYDLVWSLGDRPMGAHRNVLVAPDQSVPEIDLRTALHRISVSLVAPGGARDKFSGPVFWRETGTEEWHQTQLRDNPFRLVAAAPSVDLRIYPAGYCRLTANAVAGERAFTLRAGVKVHLDLDTSGTLPALPYVFDPDPTVDGNSVGRAVGSPYFTADKRRATFVLPPGPVSVLWHLERREKNGAVGGRVLSGHSVLLEIGDAPAEQTFRLPLDGAALDRLMRSPPW